MLIICSECGKEYSDQAKTCPNCGAITAQNKYISNNMKQGNNRNGYYQKNTSLIKSIIFIIVIVVAFVVGEWLVRTGREGTIKQTNYELGRNLVYQK